jgi:hypothetical protein
MVEFWLSMLESPISLYIRFDYGIVFIACQATRCSGIATRYSSQQLAVGNWLKLWNLWLGYLDAHFLVSGRSARSEHISGAWFRILAASPCGAYSRGNLGVCPPAELPGNRQQEFQIESVPKRGPSWDGPIRIRRRRWVTADLEPAVGDAALK